MKKVTCDITLQEFQNTPLPEWLKTDVHDELQTMFQIIKLRAYFFGSELNISTSYHNLIHYDSVDNALTTQLIQTCTRKVLNRKMANILGTHDTDSRIWRMNNKEKIRYIEAVSSNDPEHLKQTRKAIKRDIAQRKFNERIGLCMVYPWAIPKVLGDLL
jgi:hypothetical protein